jgi:nucleotide-binding universal stress UspA family protein
LQHALVHPVIVSYDGSAAARNALAYASGLARNLGRPLLIVYVAHFHLYGGPLLSGVAELYDTEQTERWLHTEFREVVNPDGIDVYVHARRGSPARELTAAVNKYSAEALVIGAPPAYWRHFVGSVPAWFVKRARCPVIVVP